MTNAKDPAEQLADMVRSGEPLYDYGDLFAKAGPLPETGWDDRPCTCHPDDNPPKQCMKRYALSECRIAALESELAQYKREFPACEVHKPTHGARGNCLICALQSLSGALSQIDYAVECSATGPNEYEVSLYDAEPDEGAVVERVKARLATLEAENATMLALLSQTRRMLSNNAYLRTGNCLSLADRIDAVINWARKESC